MSYVKRLNEIMKASAREYNSYEVVEVAKETNRKLFTMMDDVLKGKEVDIKALVLLTLKVMELDGEVAELKSKLKQEEYDKTVELIREMKSKIKESNLI